MEEEFGAAAKKFFKYFISSSVSQQYPLFFVIFWMPLHDLLGLAIIWRRIIKC